MITQYATYIHQFGHDQQPTHLLYKFHFIESPKYQHENEIADLNHKPTI